MFITDSDWSERKGKILENRKWRIRSWLMSILAAFYRTRGLVSFQGGSLKNFKGQLKTKGGFKYFYKSRVARSHQGLSTLPLLVKYNPESRSV
jgi:hypothetical protein